MILILILTIIIIIITTTTTNVGHAAHKSAISKTQKYQSILQTHLLTPIAIETAGVAKQENSSQNLGNVSPLSPGK